MKIVINLLPFRRKLGGAGKYAQNIVQQLSKLDKQNEYYLFVSEEGKVNFETGADNFMFVIAGFNPESFFIRILWEQFIFPLKLLKIKPDVIFTPSVAIPFLYKGKFATTIHDLAYKKIKTKYSWLRRKYVEFVTTIAAKKSDIIFTVSEFSKIEIEKEFFSNQKKKVLITYNGVDDKFFCDFNPDEINNFKSRHNLPENYILYVGAVEPGKNLDKLFQAFSSFVKEQKEFFLAVTSSIGWNNKNLINLIEQLGIKDKVLFLPYIPEKDLPMIYKCSKMLAYLSSYEGFGIPVLEALASGTPVITSNSSAIIEFAGESVLAVNPININEIVDGMNKIINCDESILTKINLGKTIAQKI